MAFAASLLAYFASIAGIVLAMAMSLTVLFATPPDQPATTLHKVAATLMPSKSQAATTVSVKTSRLSFSKLEPRGVRHRVLMANGFWREKPSQPLDLRGFTKQGAYHPAPDIADKHLGYAEEPANWYDRFGDAARRKSALSEQDAN